MKLKLLQVKEARGHVLNSSDLIAELMAEESKADRECFWVLHLNTQMRLIEKELVSMGKLDAAVVHPREIFKKAIINSSYSIITVHNHPSGSLIPSPEDIKTWRRLEVVGELVGIEVLDNLIITPSGSYYSDRNENPNSLDHKADS